MCTACDPEPVDEQPVAETRGGDRLADITVPEFATGGIVQPPLPFPGPESVTAAGEDEDE